MMTTTAELSTHYGRAGLLSGIEAALRAAGKDPAHLDPRDLSGIDQFHARGREATADLARRTGLGPGDRVLDAGGAFGGAARMLAADFGCTVTVLDLTADYVQAGEALTRATGQEAMVTFRQGSVMDMPFGDGEFDCVFTQHVAMNVADKARMYGEFRRVLRPGGRLALHDVMAGEVSPPLFPVPWARTADLSHLLAPEATRRTIESAGFRVIEWVDESVVAHEWFQRAAARAQNNGPRAASVLPLIFGADAAAMSVNFARNIAEKRIVIVQAVCDKADS